MAKKRGKPPAPKKDAGRKVPAKAYEIHREAQANVQAEKSKSGRDISPIPLVHDPERRERGRRSFEAYCREYHPNLFFRPWSPDHRTAIDKIEKAALEGGKFAWAMPRGGGKDALILAASLWVKLYGLHQFIVLIGPEANLANGMLESEKTELETNDRLYEDFPEVCYPIRKLDGIAQRANGQLYQGKRTHIGWKEESITFPFTPGSISSSARVVARGITGSIRGLKFTRPDGKTVRPSFVLINDPQTDESAKSPQQNNDRERVVEGAILGLAGPGEDITAIMPCTVIQPEDLAHRFLDRKKHPDWQGECHRMLYGWPPPKIELWEQYKKIRADAMRAVQPPATWNDFYIANREAMDTGLRAAWDSRKSKLEVSAIQSAMNIWCDKPKAFFAEYQNDPQPDVEQNDQLTVDEIKAKANGLPRRVVPREATKLVAFIDVQKELLYFTVLSLEGDFTGHVVDYGTYPDQKREYFAKTDARRTLMIEEKAVGFEESLRKGLDTIAANLLSRQWQRQDGAIQKIERCLVDAHWGDSTEIVRTFCRQSPHAATLTPSFGYFIGASSKPLTERAHKKGDRRGLNWIMPLPKPAQVRHVLFDSNFYKTFRQERLRQSPGGAGCFTIFGTPEDHALFADHQNAEYPVETEGRGRKVIEWKNRPQRPDNDFLDCLTGCCVAGSIEGVNLTEMPADKPRQRVKVKLSSMQKTPLN